MMRDGKVVPTVFDCITYLPDIKAYFQSMETKYPDDRQFRMYKEVIDESLNLLNEQNWIKCSDKMPEEHETIFAKFKDTDKWSPAMFAQSSEDVRVVIVFADGTRRVSHSHTIDGKWECEKHPLKRTVTHWMPNPELPKEDR